MQRLREIKEEKAKRVILQKIAEEGPEEYKMWGINIDKIKEYVDDDGKFRGEVYFRYQLAWVNRYMRAKLEGEEWEELKKKF